MEFSLSLIEHKIEFFEAYSIQELEKRIAIQIENNKALLLKPGQINYQTVYQPELNKVIYSACIHFVLSK